MKEFTQYMDKHHQGDFSKKTGIDQGVLSQIKKEHRLPTLKQATKIHTATNGAIPILGWYADKVGRKWQMR